jgi:hypothetical protein
MWGIIFFIYLIVAIIVNTIMIATSSKKGNLKTYLRCKKLETYMIFFFVGLGFIALLIAFGYLCYFLGGFLVFEDIPVGEKIIYGMVSIFCGLLFVTGVIAMFKSL